MGTTAAISETTDSEVVDRARMYRYLAVSLAWYVVLMLLPEDYQGPWYLAFGIGSLVVVYRRIRVLPSPVRVPTTIILAAAVASLSGATIRAIHGLISGVEEPFPSVADIFHLASYVLLLIAIFNIVRRRVPHLTLDPILDAVVGGIAAALLQWSLVLLPYLDTPGIPTAAVNVNLIYNVFSLLLVVAAVLALVAGSRPSPSNRLLALGLVSTFAVDIVATLVTSGRVSPQVQLYLSPMVLIFSAAGMLHPSVLYISTPLNDPTQNRRISRRRISVLALALLTPPVLMLWAALELDVDGWYLLPAAASLALTPLVVTRLGRLVRQNEELASLEATLRGVGERLVSAETTEDVVRVITVGTEQVLGSNYIGGGLIASPLSREAELSAGDLLPAIVGLRQRLHAEEHPTTGELLSLQRSGADDEHWTAGLVVVQRELHGVLALVTRRPLTDDERNAVTALCRESAIAFRAVEHTEQKVRQRSEDRFAALVDNSSDIVAVLGPDLRLTYVSPVAHRLLGYPASELADVAVMDLVHAEDRDAALKMLEDIRFGLRETTEIRLRHVDGPYHWFEMVGVDLSSDPNIGGVVLNAREIDDRKQAEERLVLSEARFKALVQHSTDLVIVLEGSGNVRYASPSVTEVLDQTPEEILGLSLVEVFRESNVDWATQLHSSPMTALGTPDLLEFGFANASGEWRTIETSLTDLRAEPAVGGFVLNARDVTDRKSMEQRLRYQATHDELTGLANRIHVLDDLAGMLGRNSGSTTVAAILLGIDDFKDVNDSLGHAYGDKLLKAVAERITGMLGFGDVAARIGGDEFVIVLERGHGENHVTDLTEQLLTAIASPFMVDGRELTITASAGIVFDHDRTNTGEILLRNADIAMYRAKTLGKRQSVVFEAQMHTASFDRLELRADLARAITSDQFVAHYQPVVDIETRRIVGAEALIRWNHPRRGLLGPNLFIPLAEESGLIGPLGEWILERACTDLAAWRSEYGEPVMDFTMSVNLSVQQLLDHRIVSTVQEILGRAGLPAERLVLEVTESTLITETDKVSATMHELRQLGSRLAVDDFGTGYSSLGYIQQFEFDVLKIDKSFVDDIDQFTNQRIVTAVLDLAKQLGVRTIAEGIETEIQAGLLEDLGCKYGQGYLYSRPVPQADFRELLSADRSTTTGRATL